MEKKFSVIIPAFNAETVIEESINSVKKQQYSNYEIIVVDDYSTDKTFNVISSIEGIKVCKSPYNMKDGGARNIGIDNATGEYIIFLDADDYLVDENVLRNLNNIINDKKVDLIYLGFKSIGGRDILAIPTEENSEINARLREWKYANVWDVCWNLEFIKCNNIRFVEEEMFQDFVFYYEAILRANSYKFANFITHMYRVADNKSITSSKMNQTKIADLTRNLSRCIELIKYTSDVNKESFIVALQIQTNIVMKLLKQFEEECKREIK